MSWSLGEAQSLATKAARGAGFSWGLAEEVGVAINWLHANAAPGVAVLADYLDWRSTNQSSLTHPSERFDENSNEPPLYCPIALGCAIQDQGLRCVSQIDSGIGLVSHPLLLVPFLAHAFGQSVLVTWDDCSIQVNQHSMVCNSSIATMLYKQARCQFQLRGDINIDAKTPTRVPNSDQSYIDRLQLYAGKTYAPATEASRIAGAGAGLTDND